MSDPESPEPQINDATLRELTAQLAEQNKLLKDTLAYHRSFQMKVVQGIAVGLGTVFGATVVVSLLIISLRPLAKIEWISPIVNRVIDDLETRGKITPKRIPDLNDASPGASPINAPTNDPSNQPNVPDGPPEIEGQGTKPFQQPDSRSVPSSMRNPDESRSNSSSSPSGLNLR